MNGVHRDPWGIPHLRADTVDDLARLQGRVAATDRAWQIESERWRSAASRMSALLGRSEGLSDVRTAEPGAVDAAADPAENVDRDDT